jgi:hypothetical protein
MSGREIVEYKPRRYCAGSPAHAIANIFWNIKILNAEPLSSKVLRTRTVPAFTMVPHTAYRPSSDAISIRCCAVSCAPG